MRKLVQWSLALATAFALLCGTCLTAFAAADSPSLDWSMSGQSAITVQMKDGNGATVTDGTLTLYQVAVLEQDNGDMVYTLTDGFAASGVSLTDVTDDPSGLASELAIYVKENSITGTSVKNTDGTVTFDGLELGLYLVVQTDQSEGYYTVNPFVVSVPLDENGEWSYVVDASPKMGVLTPEPEDDTPDEDEPDDSTPDEKLPQTGQLNWPVYVLAGCGLLLVCAGGVLVFSDRRRKAAK
ncbi:MAG: LPXTG cell wall anchor domain-containing protein [Clostridiales bacterium]|nr:LPXTG cell wall anchor domain-containing protein [Clostridiales bacterium]